MSDKNNSEKRAPQPAQQANGKSSPTSSLEQRPKSVRLPRVIPAVTKPGEYQERGRTIVVCLDGTGDKFDNDNSNIVNFVRTLKKDHQSQVTYYQAGIGTYGRQGLQGGWNAALDMAVGSELGLHVRDAYQYLMHTFKEGDRICLFGFSRGAYTARCLAGMIHKVGLLPPRNLQQIPFAYEFFKDDSVEGWKQSAEFKKTFCIDVSVYFLGVFDSVSSVGVIPRQLPLSSTPSNKSRYFRHAMALDERRAKFKPCRFEDKDWQDVKKPKPIGMIGRVLTNGSLAAEEVATKKKNAYESEFEPPPAPYQTDVEEVWFVGCHADVGGGAVHNDERHKLSNITLRWMIRQCFECETGILFKAKPLAEVGLDVHSLYPVYKPTSIPSDKPLPAMIAEYEKGLPPKTHRSEHLVPVDHNAHGDGHYHLDVDAAEGNPENHAWLPEQVEDWFDAMAPMNDQLEVAKTWWVLEMWPVEYKMQKLESDEWETRVGPNMGWYRGVVDKEPRMHWTVKARMENTDYQLRARYGRDAEWKTVS